MRCPFFKWLSVYAEFLLEKDTYADNSLLRKIQALQREKENAKLLENQVTSPWNVNYQQGSKVPTMNSASELREVKEVLLKVLKVLRQLRVMFALALAALVLIALK